MKTREMSHHLNRFLTISLALFAMLSVGRLSAQNSTGTVRGTVTFNDGKPATNAELVAKNVATGALRTTTTRTDGSYVLPGMTPAVYELTARRIGSGAQTRQVVVQIGATQVQDFALELRPVQLAEIAVNAAPVAETKTSEVATNVTSAQIDKLPSTSRNFLDLAALAPGVTVTEDRIGGASVTFSAGGQSANSVNIFVDGTSFKNDLTAGGVAGQDASKGNPFPRNAIQEYRVISQNFKAEYQKSSSAIITATTKSGTNTWHGNALFGYQNQSLVGLDTFQTRAQFVADSTAAKNGTVSTFKKADYSRSLVSLSAGGPIERDKLFFFGSFEGNYQDRTNLVNFANIPSGFPALDSVRLPQYNGNFGAPFRESLIFGKLTYSASPKSTTELSFSNRNESDVRDFGNVNCPGAMCAFTEAVNFHQNVTVGQLRYNRFGDAWFNEAKVDYSRFERNPNPDTPGLPLRVYQFNNSDNVIGSNASTQDYLQQRVGFRDDFTYTGFHGAGDHVIKVGANFDLVKYDIHKGNDETPKFLYHADGGFNFQTPYQLIYGTGNSTLNTNNNQLGAYAQDDWSPTSRLTINMGVRWDFESNMFNTGYVTPQNVIDTVTRYNSQLIHPLDPATYFSTGSNRKPFYGAIQPRLGFSYALDKHNMTTVFGGFGIYYDRSIFDVSVDETLKLTHPTYFINFAAPGVAPTAGQVAWSNAYLTTNHAVLDALVHTSGLPEAWLIANNAKVPKSQQWNLGIRHVMGDLSVAATYAAVRGVDQLVLNWANFGLNPNGSCCTSFDVSQHGFQNIIYSTNDAKTWYDALEIQVDRPYRRQTQKGIGWGAGISFTYAVRSLQGTDNLGDEFSFPNTDNIPKHPANDEKTRIVGNWIVDVPYAFGIQFSGLVTLGGKYSLDIGCPGRFCGVGTTGGSYEAGGFTVPGTFPYQRVDLRFRKDFPNLGRSALGVTLDIFNATNRNNFGCYATGNRTDANFGQPGCVVSDARRFQIGAEYTY